MKFAKIFTIMVLTILLIASCSADQNTVNPVTETVAKQPSQNLVGAITKATPSSDCLPTTGSTSGKPPQWPETQAVSLKLLQKNLNECHKENACPEELLQFSGLTRVTGYVIDKENSDIIFMGQSDPQLPPLYMEDFVIALRNAWHQYDSLEGSAPACSIDPNPKVVQELFNLGQQILKNLSPDEVARGIKDWHRICEAPQTVRVLGIPFDTHFAKVMVKADYDMKKLVDGSDSLKISGLTSLTEMTLNKVRDDVTHKRPVSIPMSSMNRFWFHPGKSLYEEAEGIVRIKQLQVTLLTEEQHVSTNGRFSGSGGVNSLAQQFAENFTAHYAEVAKQRPIYAELENLFRFVALAKVIQSKSAHTEAGLDLKYLLEEYPVSKTPVERQLAGRSQVKEETIPFPGGYAQLWLPSCGGVEININGQFESDKNLSVLQANVLDSRPFITYRGPHTTITFHDIDVIDQIPNLTKSLFGYFPAHQNGLIIDDSKADSSIIVKVVQYDTSLKKFKEVAVKTIEVSGNLLPILPILKQARAYDPKTTDMGNATSTIKLLLELLGKVNSDSERPRVFSTNISFPILRMVTCP